VTGAMSRAKWRWNGWDGREEASVAKRIEVLRLFSGGSEGWLALSNRARNRRWQENNGGTCLANPDRMDGDRPLNHRPLR